MTLAEFLLARYAEDEAACLGTADTVPIEVQLQLMDLQGKRLFVEHLVSDGFESWGGPEVFALLALPYAAHPDFRAEWALAPTPAGRTNHYGMG